MLAFGLLALLLVLVRGNLLWSNGMMNPDEAELMAEGRTAALDLFPYSGYTSSTHLFLWPFALGALELLGVPLTLVTAHVIGGLCYVLISTTGWFLMMRRIGGFRAALLVLPTATVLLMGHAPDGALDFLSMASEELSLVILAIAALVMLGPTRPMSSKQLVVGSLVGGLAVWAKPQSGPVAVALIAACVFMTCVERQRSQKDVRTGAALRYILRSGALAMLAFVTPTLVFLGVMGLGGTLDDFARESLAAMWNYTAHRDVSQGIVAPPLTDRLSGIVDFAKSYPFAAAWALGAVFSLGLLTRLESRLLRGLALAAIVLPVVAALICLLPIHPLFAHYANFLYLGCLLASCVAVRLAVPGQDNVTRGRWVEATLLGGSVAAVVILVLGVVPGRFSDFSFREAVPRDATPLAADCPAGSRVLAWGWTSELYVYYDWVPASRYVNGTWVIYPSLHQAEYASTLRGELQRNPPDCIVEALGPAFFANIDPTNTLSTVVPGISPLLASCYKKSAANTFDGRAVTLYRRTANCASD